MSFAKVQTIVSILIAAILFGCAINKRHYIRDTPIFYKNLYNLSNHDKFLGPDSVIIYYFKDGKINSFGKYGITKTGSLSNLKVGKWIEYYENGRIKSEGDYNIGRLIDCGPGGLEQTYYNYKVGFWNYYYPDGKIKATGKYLVTRCKVHTRCGNNTLNFGLTTKQWKFYGNDASQDLREYESVTNVDEYFVDVLYFDRQKNIIDEDSQPINK